MTEPLIAFCTTCKGRLQHLRETLPQNMQDNLDYPNCKFVVLNYGSPDGMNDYLRETFGGFVAMGKLAVYSFREAGGFQMAHAKNMAHRAGMIERADILVNVDADNFTRPGFARFVAQQFAAHKNAFLWSCQRKDSVDRLPRGISGRIAVTRNQFLKAGGYDEKYDTWGPDDVDFKVRLTRLGCEPREIDRQYLDAIRHGDKLRFKDYRHAATMDGEDSIQQVHESDTTVANNGNIGCGTVYRNFGNSPIVLKPLPTRIFGIGMHKTATTSLHNALKILGCDSGHWERPEWARAIWMEMQEGRSRTLERHYAASDLPITILYKELDKAYPGSKFILTTRDEQKWLESVRKHWSYEHNEFRAFWDQSPFTHRLHKMVYGTRNFESDVFLDRYRAHNAEVREYFKQRPGDLLEMPMDAGAGWNALCSFLSRPIPAVLYPHSYVQGKMY